MIFSMTAGKSVYFNFKTPFWQNQILPMGTADGLYNTAQKIMHAPEVAQEVFALQEHARPSKK